jgi:hypothetical protein
VRVAAQWERGVVLRLGKFHGLKGPGVILVFPVLDSVRFVDTRLLTLDIPHQQVITRDNVPVRVDGVIFFRVGDPERAVITVQDYRFAVSQYAQASLRDVIGSMTLDELLSERDRIQSQIASVVESRASSWGTHIDSIRLLDIDMPEDLKRMMSRQASAEREKRATITKAEGDRDAALNLAAAAATMASSPGAMQLRTLQTLDGLGSSPSNTVVLRGPGRGARAGQGAVQGRPAAEKGEAPGGCAPRGPVRSGGGESGPARLRRDSSDRSGRSGSRHRTCPHPAPHLGRPSELEPPACRSRGCRVGGAALRLDRLGPSPG